MLNPCTGAAPRLLPALPLQARKLESELDVKIAAYGKLCSGYEYGYAKGESGLAADQQLQSKAGEIERLLARLSDANDAMRSTLSGGADARSHTLARHRDILHDFQQVATGGMCGYVRRLAATCPGVAP
jgi:Golgi SNAP receptor complex protein 1